MYIWRYISILGFLKFLVLLIAVLRTCLLTKFSA